MSECPWLAVRMPEVTRQWQKLSQAIKSKDQRTLDCDRFLPAVLLSPCSPAQPESQDAEATKDEIADALSVAWLVARDIQVH